MPCPHCNQPKTQHTMGAAFEGVIIMMKYSDDTLSRVQQKVLREKYRGCKRFRGNSWLFDTGMGEVTLYSYNKLIATWKQGTKPHPQLWIVNDAFECSATTSRHLSMFIREYTNGCLTFQECKKFITDAGYMEYERIKGIDVVCC